MSQQVRTEPGRSHYHIDPATGRAIACFHKGTSALKTLLAYLLLTAVMFPIEHTLFAKVEPFATVSASVEAAILSVADALGLRASRWPKR